MAYIGNTASTRYVANRAASVYSGDGSTVAFTLEEAVGSDEDILVSVDGVIQEPSVAYTVSSGTTLDFGEASPPSSNAGNNIFVYYLSLAKGSIVHPSNVGLTATTGVFSSNATVAGTLGVTGVATGTIIKGTTSLQTPLIEFTDGDDAITIADGGVVTLLTTAVAKSEGGAVTTNIAQGLAKQWVKYNQETPAMLDSFNTTSVTNTSAGDYSPVFTNNMNNALYSTLATSVDEGSAFTFSTGPLAISTSTYEINTANTAGTKVDCDHASSAVHGDLA